VSGLRHINKILKNLAIDTSIKFEGQPSRIKKLNKFLSEKDSDILIDRYKESIRLYYIIKEI